MVGQKEPRRLIALPEGIPRMGNRGWTPVIKNRKYIIKYGIRAGDSSYRTWSG